MSEEIAAPETVAEQAPVVETQDQAPAAIHDANIDSMTNETSGKPLVEENRGKERLNQRFSEITAQRRAAEQEAEQARQEAEYWRQQALRTQPEEPAYDNEPDISKEVDRILAEREQKAAQQQAQNTRQEKAQTLSAKLIESGLEGAILLATDQKAPVTFEMVEALAVSEQAAQVADHLGRNPSEVARIAKLPPHLQGYELARLEARLASQPKTTNALPPVSTVGARAAASTDPKSMTFEQYKAARESGQL